ncbi:MAG: ribonucleoside-diphosphate reductase, adenosylcobalamin-dependent, partial [Victivallales bacterium]|nr:ribonucleoside-diphosphate reductase, adenosylcobalamin-dependent [Victivallales bacterium]
IRYGSPEAVALSKQLMQTIAFAAYDASADGALEKGAFPLFDRDKYLAAPFIQALPESVREKIRANGIRNSHLTSIAPTGTISLLAGNVSSGIEPVFAFHYVRRIRQGQEGDTADHEVMDYAYAEYCRRFGRPESDASLPPAFVQADAVAPREHIDMQAALQEYVDSAISKTINVPEDFPFEEFKGIYTYAHEQGLKGCTTFRPSEHITGVLIREEESPAKAAEQEQGDMPPRRPEMLHGTTYKVKTPVSKNAFYITINDIDDGDSRRPYEIFVNTKNLQHYSWVVAMTRLISAVFRREGDPSFLVEELVSIHDPNGGYYSNGEYVPSLPAEVGRLIASHLKSLGIMLDLKTEEAPPEEGESVSIAAPSGPRCPMCNEPGLQKREGCLVCPHCGFSKCG